MGDVLKIPDEVYRHLGRCIDDSLVDSDTAREYFIIEIDGEPFIFSFHACSGCKESPCLLFVRFIPLFCERSTDFSLLKLGYYYG